MTTVVKPVFFNISIGDLYGTFQEYGFPAAPLLRDIAKAAGLPSEQNLGGRRMTQETQRTCRRAVGPGLKNNDPIADVSLGQPHPVGQKVQRRAQRSDDRSDLVFAAELVADGDRVVFPQHLPKIAGSSKMMMKSAVRDKERLVS
jgi:hypothetical protein